MTYNRYSYYGLQRSQ